MEILAEVLGWLLHFLFELLLQVGFELLAELLGHSLQEPLRRPGSAHPTLALLGYLLYGGSMGGLSLWFFPHHFVHVLWLKAITLVLVPVAAGVLMALIGVWRNRQGKSVIRLETFLYGFVFALAMALVRAIWAH